MSSRLSADLVLMGYREGAFLMGDTARGPLRWHSPDPRALLPLDERFRVSRSLSKLVRRRHFEIRMDTAFEEVVRRCAEPAADRPSTWITPEIICAYTELHRQGKAHSVEAWLEGALAGGLYGVALGGAFFGESMFSRVPDTSKVALVALVERLRARGFVLLDTQFMTPHLARFGAFEIPREEYLRRLRHALHIPARWDDPTGPTNTDTHLDDLAAP
jgi:leucyl/phenylalanyl-tRNA---protein transferase